MSVVRVGILIQSPLLVYTSLHFPDLRIPTVLFQRKQADCAVERLNMKAFTCHFRIQHAAVPGIRWLANQLSHKSKIAGTFELGVEMQGSFGSDLGVNPNFRSA